MTCKCRNQVVTSCNRINLILEFSSSLPWQRRWASPFEREDKLRKFHLILCQCSSHTSHNSISVLRPCPLLTWCFGRFGLVGYDAFKQSVWASNGALSAIGTPNSTSPAPHPCNSTSVWVISCAFRCCAYCDGRKGAYFLFFTAVSLFSTRTITFNARADCAVIDRSSILLVATIIVTSTCIFSSNWSDLLSTGLMHNDPHYTYQETLSVRSDLLSIARNLRPFIVQLIHSIRSRFGGGFERRLLTSLSHRACLLNVARVITTITRHELSFVWLQHHVASHGNVWRNVFGGNNHC